MDKTVEKIVINSEGIDVVSSVEGVNNVVQLNLEPQRDEIQQIFNKYNLEKGVIYHYDEKIIRALSENKEQLVDYLDVCRKASYPAKKVKIPESIPEIEYDLRELKTCFSEIEDEDLRKRKQIQMYNKAKEVYSIFKDKTTLRMGILDRAYFQVQELLQSKNNKTTVLMLKEGENNRKEEFRKNIQVEQLNKISQEKLEKENQQKEEEMAR